jgi:hypothetical protein
LTVTGAFTWTGGTETGNPVDVSTNIASPISVTFNGAQTYISQVQYYNAGLAVFQQYGLVEQSGTTTFNYNLRGAEEKYLISDNGSNAANGSLYFIVPDGDVYAWDGNSIVTSVQSPSNLVANVGSAIYANPALLNNPQLPYDASVFNLEQTLALTGPTASNSQYETFKSTNGSNGVNGGIYYLAANGNLYAGLGSFAVSTAAALASLGTAFFANPTFLTDPSPNGALSTVSTSPAGNVVTVSDDLTAGNGFLGTTVITVTASNNTIYTFEVTFNDATPVWSAPANQSVTIPAATSTNSLPLNSTDASGDTLNYTAQIGGYNSLFNVEQQLDLMAPSPGNYQINSRGYEEEYLVSGNGSNPTGGGFYILIPNGNLYPWDSHSVLSSEGGTAYSLGQTVYLNPTLLIDAAAPYDPAAYSTQQALDLQTTPGNNYLNARGAQEEYLLSGSGSNPAGYGYYILLPSGNLYALDAYDISHKSLTTTLETAPVAELPTLYYQNPSLLINATPPSTVTGLTANFSGDNLTVSDTNFLGTANVYLTASDGALSTTQSFLVTFTDSNAPSLGISASSETVDHKTSATATLTPSAGTSYQTPKIGGADPLLAIEQEYDLMETPGVTNYFLNVRGEGEEYLVSNNGSNPGGGGYYVLFNNGNMFAYTPDAGGNLSQTVLNTAISVGSAAYGNPTLLTAATPGYNPAAYAAEQAFDLQGPSDPNFFFNSRGDQEKYLVSGNNSNPAGGGYYIIVPNGNLYAWAGSLATTLAATPAATVPVAFYTNPNFLVDAEGPGVFQVVSSVSGVSVATSAVTASLSGNLLTVSDINYVGSVTVYVTVSDGYLTATQSFTVTFTDANPPTLGVSPSSMTVSHTAPATATLNPSAGTSYTSVQVGGYNSLFALEQQYDLMETPGVTNYLANSRGESEEYLVSGNGSNPGGGGYYVLFNNGNMYAYVPDAGNDLNSTVSGTAISVGNAAYVNPILITNASPAYTYAAYNAEQTLHLQVTPNYYYNARGAEEKYLISGNGSNSANGGYYVLMPNGNLYAWTGNSLTSSLSEAPVAALPTAYYINPGDLIYPVPPGGLQYVSSTATSVVTTDVNASISGSTLTVNDPGGYLGTVLVYVTISDGAMTATQTFQVTFS